MTAQRFTTVDQYIKSIGGDVGTRLQPIRSTIQKAVPEAVEYISYNMTSYKYHGRLVYFAAFTKHIGFYPMTETITHFENELKKYRHAPGSVQLPNNQALPLGLIKKMVAWRAKFNLSKVAVQ